MNYRNRSGFTLAEILVVLAVISLLIGLLTSGGIAAKRQAKIFQTRTLIASLEAALDMYHVDFGAYPSDVNQQLWVNLLADSSTYAVNNDWKGPYISFDDNQLSGSLPNATVIDAWSNGCHYALDTVPPYRIWSDGTDGVDNSGAGDDITSW